MKKIIILLVVILAIAACVNFFGPFRSVNKDQTTQIFMVSEESSENSLVAKDLENRGFIRSSWALDFALTLKNKSAKIQPGGYYLAKSMNTWQIADKLTSKPDLQMVSFAEGLRKEQIGEKLQKALGWSDQELKKWDEVYTTMQPDFTEGVYFPDTYLIPTNESGPDIAKRMIANFNEKVGAQINEFAKENVRWTTGLKIASIIQREAAGAQDMPLIAGIIWNRLNEGQALQLDATIQYAKGKTNGVWWSVVTPSDIKNIDSLYNTYEYKGLPPHPISNPGLDAINAALHPQTTDCLYYLHDHSSQIHCAVTYKEHLVNIKKYLN